MVVMLLQQHISQTRTQADLLRLSSFPVPVQAEAGAAVARQPARLQTHVYSVSGQAGVYEVLTPPSESEPRAPSQHGGGTGAGTRHMSTGASLALRCDNRAMQYYRLWIYTCNGLLLLCVLGFAVVACRTVVLDQRRHLVPGLSLLHPTFLYAYLAVATQSGIVQLIGCLGARKLNQRLLNIYWLSLLLLLFGDAMVGVVWVFRFERICTELRPWLKQRLAAEYGIDPSFTAIWDSFQREHRCCGAENAYDFPVLNRSNWQSGWLPESCCWSAPAPTSAARYPRSQYLEPPKVAAIRNFHYHGTTTSTPSTTTVSAEDEYHMIIPSSGDPPGKGQDKGELFCGQPSANSNSSTANSTSSLDASSVPLGGGRIIAYPGQGQSGIGEIRYHRVGCEERLLRWLRQSADLLFILGYCVIGFLKLCFLGILRYEIKEMIQKIKVLQGELNAPQIASPDQPSSAGGGAGAGAGGDPGRKSPVATSAQAARFSNNNGSLVTRRGPDDSPVIGTSRTPQEGRGRADSGTTPLLLQPAESLQSTPMHQHQQQHTPQLHQAHQRHHHLSLHDGNDSDTNSHCALLISEDRDRDRERERDRSAPQGGGGGGSIDEARTKVNRQGSNGNNNYELHELHELNRILARHRNNI